MAKQKIKDTTNDCARENWVCVKCSGTVRHSSGKCKACANAYAAAYRVESREKMLVSQANYRMENRATAKARSQAWRDANKDHIKEFFKVRYEQNAEQLKAAARQRYQADPEKARKAKAHERAAHPERQIAADARYRVKHADVLRIRYSEKRARRMKAPGTLSKDLAKRLFSLQKGLCPCCRQPLGTTYHMDHIVPLIAGGTNTDDNIQLLRNRCNQQKSAKHPIDFMQSRGFLL